MKQISIDGNAVLVNMDKVCAIAENYIQFDGGHVIWGKVDIEPTVSQHVQHVESVGEDESALNHVHWMDGVEHDT